MYTIICQASNFVDDFSPSHHSLQRYRRALNQSSEQSIHDINIYNTSYVHINMFKKSSSLYWQIATQTKFIVTDCVIQIKRCSNDLQGNYLEAIVTWRGRLDTR